MIPPETLKELTQLRDRVAYLEAELEMLHDRRNRGIEDIVRELGVTVNTARLLAALAHGGILTRDQAMAMELFRLRDGDPRSLDSQVKRLRRQLPWITIKTIYGLGYEIEDEVCLKRLRAITRGQK